MKKLKVVITSGGTREYIDDVRILTNISTGKLGAMIAGLFGRNGHQVIYVAPANAAAPTCGLHYNTVETRIVTNVKSVMDVMKDLVPKADVVIQCMAIGDFTFELNGPVKISSEGTEAFVEHIRNTIRVNPKVISFYRDWNPKAVLVGFKFTVGKSSKELIKIAKELKEKNRLDMVFANDKAKMQEAGDHVGTLIMDEWEEKVRGKDEIAEAIYSNVIRVYDAKYAV